MSIVADPISRLPQGDITDKGRKLTRRLEM